MVAIMEVLVLLAQVRKIEAETRQSCSWDGDRGHSLLSLMGSIVGPPFLICPGSGGTCFVQLYPLLFMLVI
jgi:hypothetical protein